MNAVLPEEEEEGLREGGEIVADRAEHHHACGGRQREWEMERWQKVRVRSIEPNR